MVDLSMRFRITIDAEAREIELDPSTPKSDDEYFANTKEEHMRKKVTVLGREKNRIIIGVNNRVYSVLQLVRTRSSVTFVANGKSIEARRESESPETEESSLLASNKELIVSNFPAKIVRLNMKPGDKLKQGETLIVLEAMKMEAQIKAPRDCTVEQVYVKEGEMIERGKPMIKLKFR
jgi:glutaconyl-CoA/methylmalonyl-CoA decarboxylase subunit gamma